MQLNSMTLILHNMGRKRMRSLLLVLSIGIAFFIYAVLASFEAGFNATPTGAERLVVTNRIGTSQPLPISQAARIAEVAGVQTVTSMSRMRATYREATNFLGANAVDPRSYAAFFAEQYDFKEVELLALEAQRTGVIVGRALALREGWQIGQRIVLEAVSDMNVDGTRNWPFEIVGILDGKSAAADTNFVVFRWDYFNAARAQNRDTVSSFGVLPAPGVRPADVIREIDARFANSAFETRTRTESDYMKAFVAQFADISTIVGLVVGAAFLTILMIVANTMFFAIRERTQEIGVLKVLGFSPRYILGSVLAETVTLFIFGLGIGLAAAMLAIVLLAGQMSTIVPGMALSGEIVVKAVGLALLFAVLTGGMPALNAMRISTRNALKGA